MHFQEQKQEKDSATSVTKKFGTRIVQKGLMWLVILYIAANQLTLLCTENGSTPYYVQSTWAC